MPHTWAHMLMTGRARGVLLSLILILVLAACAVASPLASAPRSLSAQTQRVSVVVSGADSLPSKRAWLADVRAALRDAPSYLDARAKRGGRLAIVLDIDNTSLATHYDWPNAVPPTLAVAQRARSLGYAVFFVTGRYYADLRNVTGPLRDAGYDYTGICGRNPRESIKRSKQRCRATITNMGYTITASIANNRVDFAGGDYERGFALPNYGGRLS